MSHLSFQLVVANPPNNPFALLCAEWAELRLAVNPENVGGAKKKGRLARRPKYQNLCFGDLITDGCFPRQRFRKKTARSFTATRVRSRHGREIWQ